jgi:hypothetical protein
VDKSVKLVMFVKFAGMHDKCSKLSAYRRTLGYLQVLARNKVPDILDLLRLLLRRDIVCAHHP